MLCMNAFSIGPKVEATNVICENMTPCELSRVVHDHRTLPDDGTISTIVTFGGISRGNVREMAKSTAYELDLRSMLIMHEQNMDVDDSNMCESLKSYLVETDYNLRRYLGVFVTSSFVPKKLGGLGCVVITSLTASRQSQYLIDSNIPFYSTLVALESEAMHMIGFAETGSAGASMGNDLIATEWFGLEDVTQVVFADLVAMEAASQ